MRSESDVERLAEFIHDTVEGYRFVAQHGRRIRRAERELLLSAIEQFASERPERIVAQYRALSDEAATDAGLTGEELRAKTETARISLRELRQGRTVQEDPPTGQVRRWLKRAKVLVDTLKGLLPGAVALSELLDLIGAALDS